MKKLILLFMNIYCVLGHDGITICKTTQSLKECVKNRRNNIILLTKGIHYTYNLPIPSDTIFIIPKDTIIKVPKDAKLNPKAYGGVANSVISSKGTPEKYLENITIILNGIIDGNKEIHTYKKGGLEGIDWAYVRNSTITGTGKIVNANGDGLDIDASEFNSISNITTELNGGSGVHLGSPRPISSSKLNIFVNVKSNNNGYDFDKNGFDVSWPNPLGAIFINTYANKNNRNYQLKGRNSKVLYSYSKDSKNKDDFSDADEAIINNKNVTNKNILSSKLKILLKRDFKKILGLETPKYLENVNY
ncbi:hypothetical protein [Halobacteriovorax sp. CON-3]|uniref:hypothetical protein n=1 Tax=Halobacteriovorax sp. CON-3 TaxID=3157710 RepID=UPI003722C82D